MDLTEELAVWRARKKNYDADPDVRGASVNRRSMGSNRLILRSIAMCIAVLLHIAVVVGFLSGLHVGLVVRVRPEMHPSVADEPLIASIISLGVSDKPVADSIMPLNGDDLPSIANPVEVPTTAPTTWWTEHSVASATTRPAAAVGEARLHCEVHIHQSTAGRVEAIDFGDCTRDRLWQHTLLRTLARAAQLVESSPENRFLPVRTLVVTTDNLSPILLARQLSSAELFKNETSAKGAREAHSH